MNNSLSWIGLTVALLTAGLIFMVAMVNYQPVCNAPQIAVSQEVPQNNYADSCVVSITHPELSIQLEKIIQSGDGCQCHYWFVVKNRTTKIGTKAYQVEIIPQVKQEELWQGQAVQTRRMDGVVNHSIKKIYYADIHNEVHFVIQGPCPKCLSYQAGPYSYQSGQISFQMRYLDCSGERIYKVTFNLLSQEVTPQLIKVRQNSGSCP